MAYQSHAAAAIAQLARAVDAGLVAAAALYQGEMKRRLQEGYTSGDYVTGHSARSVVVTDPEPGPGGSRQIRVGTNVDYNRMWELGFVHGATGRHWRVEKWRPALEDLAAQMMDEFGVTAAGVFAGGPAPAAPDNDPSAEGGA